MIGIIFLSIIGYLAIGLVFFGLLAKFSDITIKELEEDRDAQGATAIVITCWPLVIVFILIIGFIKLYKLSLKHIFGLSKDDDELKEKKATKEKTKVEKKAKKNSINRHELLDFEE